MGKSAKDNFKRRFGDPVRIKIEYAKDKTSHSEDEYRSEQISKAYAGVLKGVLGREPTQDEIIGVKDISMKARKKSR
jgi:hypothetical protein